METALRGVCYRRPLYGHRGSLLAGSGLAVRVVQPGQQLDRLSRRVRLGVVRLVVGCDGHHPALFVMTCPTTPSVA